MLKSVLVRLVCSVKEKVNVKMLDFIKAGAIANSLSRSLGTDETRRTQQKKPSNFNCNK